jgi:hypothetical protein
MRSRITLLIGLSTVFLFLSIYGVPYVNGQSSINDSSDNETGSANSASQTENLDPFVLRGSSDTGNTGNNNDAAQADDGSSTNSNNDDDGSSTNSNNDDDGSSTNSNNDESNKDGSDDDNSSKEDKESKDDRKFELPFP